MFKDIFKADSAIARHRAGPLAIERDRYLCHCAAQGATYESLRLKARSIFWVAQRITPGDFGRVNQERLLEIVCGGIAPAPRPTTALTLMSSARSWFKFLKWWYVPQEPISFEADLNVFVSWMRDERGLTPCTVEQWRYRVGKFLQWCKTTDRNLRTLRVQDIDAYFISYGAQRWSRTSAGQVANMLRVFLRHAASTGTCSPLLANSILTPRRYALESLPYALNWSDVRNLIVGADGDDERSVRDRAILMLLAIYGLRRGEVASLRLDQIDLAGRQLRIWRMKRDQAQVYPLVPSVAQALERYIVGKRPKVAFPEVFIRLQAPRTPITAPAIYDIVNRRLKALGVQAAHLGPHALRHSCAVKLVAEGLSLKEIGDHLGHRSTSATSTYAKVDLAALREVGNFDLGGVR